ncbi:MAG: baseplate J/gp47 family protein [Synergistaceae bacterium]|nr:baseplate J/gp47 family protein [Synergistaceae bacterium]
MRYRIGGGVAGNVAPNTITNVRDIATDTAGNRVSIRVTNPEWASGGNEPESIDSIKLWAPRFFEAQRRCVTQQDYETFASNFSGIAKAKAIVRERTGEANVIRIYVLTYGDKEGTVAPANQVLIDSLLDYLDKFKMLTDWIEIENGSSKSVDFSGQVIISGGFSADSIRQEINNVLRSLMDIETREMGEPLRISDVYAAIDNIEGVIFVELDTPAQTITPELNEMLVLGKVDFRVRLKEGAYYGQNF